MGLLEAVVVIALVVRGVVMVIPSSHYWNPAKKVENMPVEDFKDNITFTTIIVLASLCNWTFGNIV